MCRFESDQPALCARSNLSLAAVKFCQSCWLMRQTAGPSTHARLARTTPPRPLPASHRLVGYRERRSTAEISVALITCVWPFQCGGRSSRRQPPSDSPLLVETGRRAESIRAHTSQQQADEGGRNRRGQEKDWQTGGAGSDLPHTWHYSYYILESVAAVNTAVYGRCSAMYRTPSLRTLNCVDTPRVPTPVGVFSRLSSGGCSLTYSTERCRWCICCHVGQNFKFRCMREQSDKLIECLRRSLTGAELAIFLKASGRSFRYSPPPHTFSTPHPTTGGLIRVYRAGGALLKETKNNEDA